MDPILSAEVIGTKLDLNQKLLWTAELCDQHGISTESAEEGHFFFSDPVTFGEVLSTGESRWFANVYRWHGVDPLLFLLILRDMAGFGLKVTLVDETGNVLPDKIKADHEIFEGTIEFDRIKRALKDLNISPYEIDWTSLTAQSRVVGGF